MRKAPINLQEKDLALFPLEVDVAENGYYELRNAYIERDKVSPSPSLFIRVKSLLGKPIQKIECGIWITEDQELTYSNWLLKALPALLSLRELYSELPVLLPEEYRQHIFVETTLNLMNRSVVFLESENVSVDRLILTKGDMAHKAVIQELRANITAAIPIRVTRKIFLSSEKSTAGQITNEQALRTMLIKYGFEIHCFDDYSFEKRMVLMKETTVLIAHGESLANMLFMPEGGRVFEIRNDHSNNDYFNLASDLDHLYYYHLGTGSGDTTVNLPELEKVAKTLYKDIVVRPLTPKGESLSAS